ncbi:MAG: hypothetical protein NE330_18980, partial [Lentisphaeraceae bacterium]|nr:hypothetical protein [Lentisphaeraceae bacterium]
EINGAVREALSVSIPAGQTTSTVFQADVESAGFHKATVRIGIDNNEKDNFAFTQFEAFEQLKVLVLQNFIPETIEEKRAVFVDFALNPYPGASQAENALYKFTWNSIQSMSVDDLDEYAFIILDDVRALTTVESKFLEDYVAAGGGVMVNMGPTIDAENYNRIFYKDGKGLFAWPLLDTAVEALEEGKYLNYEVNNPNHEIWSFTGGKEVNLGMRLKKCFGFVSQTSDRALSLMKLRSEGDDRSFMAAFTYGRGRVFVNGTSSGLEWNNLALLPTFLPFYRKVSNWLMNEKYGQKKYEVGQSYTQEVSEEKSRTQFEMMAPSGSMQTIEATISGDRHFLNVESLKESGVYKLREEGKSNSRLISVNVDSTESQVTSMANDDLKTIYEPLGVKVTNKQGASTMTSSAAASEISTLLLILAILCWLGENFLSLMISRRGQNG